MKKETRLYNVIFPLWMLLMMPQMWLAVIPANFVADSLVLLIAMYALRIDGKKDFYKKTVLKVFMSGMLADITGALLLLGGVLIGLGSRGDEWYMTVPAIIISAAGIFVLDYFFSFGKCTGKERIRLSLIFAVCTAPYTFLIPSSWM